MSRLKSASHRKGKSENGASIAFSAGLYEGGRRVCHRSRLLEFGSGSQALSQLDAAVREWTDLIVYRLMGKTDGLFPAPYTLAES